MQDCLQAKLNMFTRTHLLTDTNDRLPFIFDLTLHPIRSLAREGKDREKEGKGSPCHLAITFAAVILSAERGKREFGNTFTILPAERGKRGKEQPLLFGNTFASVICLTLMVRVLSPTVCVDRYIVSENCNEKIT